MRSNYGAVHLPLGMGTEPVNLTTSFPMRTLHNRISQGEGFLYLLDYVTPAKLQKTLTLCIVIFA